MNKYNNCPSCGTNFWGDDILSTLQIYMSTGSPSFKDMTNEEMNEYIEEYYSAPYKWRREIGIELYGTHPKHYDGVSAWQCPDCQVYIGRFTDKISNDLKEVI